MRAVVLERFGEPAEVLQVRDVPVPQPAHGEIRVRMLASPINPSDLMTVRGLYGRLPQLPATPGFEGAGIVEAAGGGWLARYLLGKRIAVLNGRTTGNWCEQTVIPAKQAIPLARDLPLEQGAMFFVNPATAFLMTRTILRIPRGAWLMQTAAGSAVGRMVIRLGRRFGFHTINVVRNRALTDELQALGADAVVHFDPREHAAEVLRDEVRRIAGTRLPAFAIDPVGGPTATAVLQCLGQGGRMLLYGTLSEEPLSFSPRTLITPNASLEGFWLARWITKLGLVPKLRLMRQITRLMRAGVLVSDVEASFPLEQIAQAVRAAETPGRRGKVLLRIAADQSA